MKDIHVQQINFLLCLCSTDQRNQFRREKGGRYITCVVSVNIKYSTRTDRSELKCSSVTPEWLHGLESVQIPYSLSRKEMEISCELNVLMTVFSLCLNESPRLLHNRVVKRDLRSVMDEEMPVDWLWVGAGIFSNASLTLTQFLGKAEIMSWGNNRLFCCFGLPAG